MKNAGCFIIAGLVMCAFCAPIYGQTPPPSQTGGGIVRTEEEIARDQKLEDRVRKPKPKTEEAEIEEGALPAEEGARTRIKKIEIEGEKLIPEKELRKAIAQYEGKEMSLRDMQKACDLITDEYRKKGYATSRAYLPPQTIKGGILVIMVIEGKVSNIEVKNNKWFSKKQIKKKVTLKPGSPFDYKSLQKALVKINEHPDRFVKAVLAPGKEPGTTDIILEVTDRPTVHAGYTYDNFGSRYINNDRHTITAENNNLLGLDDRFVFKYQQGQDSFFNLTQVQYTVELAKGLEAGVWYLWSRSKLGKEYKDMKIKGVSELGGAFLNLVIIDTDSVDLRFNAGFDYKHISNYTDEQKTSRDEDRVIKGGFDLDVYDPWGRTIMTLEVGTGLTGYGVHKKDPIATRPGAGGEFTKISGNLYRLQPMPFGSNILWKNQFQYSAYNLLAVEQFQVGGIANVRSYAPAEYTGDKGYATSVEWSFPPYGIPKTARVPLSKAAFYDAIRFVGFYDMGMVFLKTLTGTDKKQRTIQGWGGGLRFNLPEDLSSRIEFAYRFDPDITFGDARMYMEASKKF